MATATIAVSSLAVGAFKDAGSATVGFQAIGPAGLKINGASNSLKAIEKDGKLEITASMKTFDTGIGLRDKHLRKAIEAEKYPSAKLTVARSGLTLPPDGKQGSGSAKGTLTFHGKSKVIPFRYKIDREGDRYAVQGLAAIDIRDFAVEVPCYLGVCVDPNVKLKVGFALVDH